jgi:hypothetical protein
MRSLVRDFQDVVAAHRDEAAADQLRHAARVLASSAGSITAITCVRPVKAGQASELSDLARFVALTYGLSVEIESGSPIAIRFSRDHSLTRR